MTRRYTHLIAVSILATAFSAPISAQQETVAEVRAKAEQGDADAQYNLGLRYGTGEGVPQNDAEAVRWLRLAADQGIAGAQFILGLTYASGEGVPQDDAEAVRWYRLAADQGDASAQFNLGVITPPAAACHRMTRRRSGGIAWRWTKGMPARSTTSG